MSSTQAEIPATTTPPPAPAGSPFSRRPAWLRIESLRRQAVLPILVAVLILAQVKDQSFLTWPSIQSMLTQNAGAGIIAIGLTFVLVGGGVDISVGSTYAVGSAVYAMQATHHNLLVAAIVTLLVGVVIGLVNGLLITRMGFHPFITTLGTASILGGGVVMYAGLNAITPTQSSFASLGNDLIGQLPYVVIALVLIFAVGSVALHRTSFGRSLFVLGGSPEVARSVGIRTNTIKVSTYVISSCCAAFAGLLFASQSGVGQADIGGNDFALTALAMVVLGGTSLYGGQGSMWRTGAGFLILSAITTLFVVLAIGQPIQDIVEGCIVIVALTLDATSRRERT